MSASVGVMVAHVALAGSGSVRTSSAAANAEVPGRWPLTWTLVDSTACSGSVVSVIVSVVGVSLVSWSVCTMFV